MYSETIKRKWSRNSIDFDLELFVLFGDPNAIIMRKEIDLKYGHLPKGCFIIQTMTFITA